MDIKTLDRANKLNHTIDTLRKFNNVLNMYAAAPLQIKYGDFSANIKTLDSETERQIITALDEVIKNRIMELTKEFENL